MSKFFKHFFLVTRHRYHVFVNGCRCGIGFHCLFHDLSKFHPTEFFRSVKNYTGTYSPVYAERLKDPYFSKICQHHTKRNKHHWEYWTDFFRGYIVVKAMPWKYATEYVCDMLSASFCYDPKHFDGQTTYRYFEARQDRYYLAPLTREYVRYCLKSFAESGFAGLKKKDTKAAYAELEKKLGTNALIDALNPSPEPLPKGK